MDARASKLAAADRLFKSKRTGVLQRVLDVWYQYAQVRAARARLGVHMLCLRLGVHLFVCILCTCTSTVQGAGHEVTISAGARCKVSARVRSRYPCGCEATEV